MSKKSVTSEVIKLPEVRLAFLRLWTPKAFKPGQDPRFEATGLLDPSNAKHKEVIKFLLKEAARIGKEFFGTTPREVLQKAGELGLRPFDPKTPADGVKFDCFYDGNTKSYDGFPGHWVVATHNKVRPLVANRRGQPVTEGEEQAPYSGCFGTLKLTLWTQGNEFGKRINANLRSVQYVRPGQAFGIAPIDADEEFEALEDEYEPAAEGGFDDDIPF